MRARSRTCLLVNGALHTLTRYGHLKVGRSEIGLMARCQNTITWLKQQDWSGVLSSILQHVKMC